MTFPTLTEIQRRLEPVTRDTFIDTIETFDTVARAVEPTDSKRQASDARRRRTAVTG